MSTVVTDSFDFLKSLKLRGLLSQHLQERTAFLQIHLSPPVPSAPPGLLLRHLVRMQ